MFYYFGRKGRLAPTYPAPLGQLVIEPFAGSMAYSLHHRPARALGIELDEQVVATWHRVTGLSSAELLEYQTPALGETVMDRWLMMAAGSHGTHAAASYRWTDRMQRDLAKQKKLAARHVDYARSAITYRHGSYQDAPDVEATWFIDPPYQHVSRGYKRDGLNFGDLAEWCRSRRGLVIVCEQEGADWLPFVPHRAIRGTTNKQSTEAVWVGGEWA